MRKPACGAWNREQHGEHIHWESKCLVDEARVEVHVGIELALHEVLVLKCNLFEFQCHVEQRILARYFENVVRSLFDDLGARVVILVHAVTKAHQLLVAVFNALNERWDIVEGLNLLEHPHDSFVGSTVQWPVEGGCCCGGG